MSDDGKVAGEPRVSKRFAEVEDELRREDGLLTLMQDQWKGMTGMAGMFIATIALAMYIRPYYDVGELHAFGASGATQVRYVAIELVAIFAFTALIIFLARWGKQYIIKYGMMAVLTLALLYSTVPLAHMFVLDFDTEAYEVTTTEEQAGDFLGTWGEDGYILAEIIETTEQPVVNITAWDSSNGYAAPLWSNVHNHSIADGASTVRMTSSSYGLTFASGYYAWTLDASTGDVTESYACWEYDSEGVPVAISNMIGGCALAVTTDEAMYLFNPFEEVERFRTFSEAPGVLGSEARWRTPGFNLAEGVIMSTLLTDDQLALVTPAHSGVLLLEESSQIGGVDNITLVFEHAPQAQATFTSADMGISPFEEDNATMVPENRRMILLGENNGTITGIEWDGSQSNDEAFSIQERMALEGLVTSVTSVSITDLDESGYTDLLIAEEEEVHWLYTTSLVNRASFSIPANNVATFFAINADQTNLVTVSQSDATTVLLQTGELTQSMFPLYGIQLLLAPTLVGLFVTAVLMILLFVHSEWYVVNTTGVLLGAGVCVMLGVTFVPALAMLFMILAAVYDFWAVYKSKHMLDLADTMIGLRLPILLVAPQGSDYSLIEETEQAKRSNETIISEDKKARVKPKKAKKNSEAMFMGLGDVIFPGMLVLSAMQWLDPSVAFSVAMTTLVGGLMGYLALMTYVARGKAQAGLPLLNGGAILGYLIGGLFFLGTGIFSFNISW
ncbi:presenilin family intramembrane aspartyl protease [Candidatus Poseidonia sp.]|nr:presenilin family intramembrane aspartyl protease [Poseidonia sp.]